jgi:hypothetical protein
MKFASVIVMLVLIVGCAAKPRPTTQPAVPSGNFIALWRACEDTAREFGFTLDREDYRGGVITTLPLTSKQFFEVWRNDVQTANDLADSSLSLYRRTLRFDIKKTPDSTYAATPTVTIERYARTETPVTGSAYLRNAFRSTGRRGPTGSREQDRGIILPRHYWYVTGEDDVLEQKVAKKLRGKLK